MAFRMALSSSLECTSGAVAGRSCRPAMQAPGACVTLPSITSHSPFTPIFSNLPIKTYNLTPFCSRLPFTYLYRKNVRQGCFPAVVGRSYRSATQAPPAFCVTLPFWASRRPHRLDFFHHSPIHIQPFAQVKLHSADQHRCFQFLAARDDLLERHSRADLKTSLRDNRPLIEPR
jgi:hypothetical protein